MQPMDLELAYLMKEEAMKSADGCALLSFPEGYKAPTKFIANNRWWVLKGGLYFAPCVTEEVAGG